MLKELSDWRRSRCSRNSDMSLREGPSESSRSVLRRSVDGALSSIQISMVISLDGSLLVVRASSKPGSKARGLVPPERALNGLSRQADC